MNQRSTPAERATLESVDARLELFYITPQPVARSNPQSIAFVPYSELTNRKDGKYKWQRQK
jgi:hypothetical protein